MVELGSRDGSTLRSITIYGEGFDLPLLQLLQLFEQASDTAQGYAPSTQSSKSARQPGDDVVSQSSSGVVQGSRKAYCKDHLGRERRCVEKQS